MTVSRPRSVSIPFEVWRVARRMQLLLDVELIGLPCSPAEVGLYSVLRVGPMTPTEVARHSGLPATTVSKMLRRVAARGHLERTENPDDGRSSLVGLNPDGRGFLTEAFDRIRSAMDRIEASLGEDTEWVAFALLRLERALSDLTGGATSGAERKRWPAKPRWENRLRYDGEPLANEDEARVREYIDWLRWQRDATPP